MTGKQLSKSVSSLRREAPMRNESTNGISFPQNFFCPRRKTQNLPFFTHYDSRSGKTFNTNTLRQNCRCSNSKPSPITLGERLRHSDVVQRYSFNLEQPIASTTIDGFLIQGLPEKDAHGGLGSQHARHACILLSSKS